MAIVSVTIIEGRDRQVKQRLMARLTDVIVEVLEAESRQVRVFINEVKDGDYSVGGQPVILQADTHE